MSTTRLRRHLPAPPEAVFRALTDGAAVARWMFPDGMSIRVDAFDARPGGRFHITLTYQGDGQGKTTARSDSYAGRFADLDPPRLVRQILAFDTADPAMQGEMTITFALAPDGAGTDLTASHEGVPPGVDPADNETGWRMALDRLGALLAGAARDPDSRPADAAGGHG